MVVPFRPSCYHPTIITHKSSELPFLGSTTTTSVLSAATSPYYPNHSSEVTFFGYDAITATMFLAVEVDISNDLKKKNT